MPATKKKQRAKGGPTPRRAPTPAPRAPRTTISFRRIVPSWPLWVWGWIALTALFFILRLGGAIRSVPLCFFLSAIAGAFFFSLDQLRYMGPAHPLLRVRQLVLVVVLVAIPPLIDPSTNEIENIPRLAVLVVAAVLLLAVWAVDAVWSGWRPRRLVNGFQWILLAIVVWFGVTTLTSVEPRLSFLGHYGSYEGFVLLAALAVLASGLAESFTFEALPALFRVVVASTMPIVVYGIIQIYGFDIDKHSSWDFIHWHAPFHNVFTTFGNPNHLGGYIATVLPLGVVTAVLCRRRWVRVAMWAWVALVLLILLQTAARGAWLGTLVGGVILGVGFLPRIRARARTVALSAGAALVVIIVLVSAGSRFLGAKASALLHFGSGTSVSQRPLYWSAALHSAAHHPLVGTGPDTWADTYARYQSATLAKQIGLSMYVDGAHNIFFSWLSNEGIPGLILIVLLFAVGLAWGIRAWRLLRSDAGDLGIDDAGTGDPEAVPGQRRYVVAALVAGLVGYFVQASFDIEQVATLFALFVGLGFLGIVNRGLWPSATLLPPLAPFRAAAAGGDADADVESTVAEEDLDYPIVTIRPRSNVSGRSAPWSPDDFRRLGAALAVAVVGLAAVGLTYWRADALWRADHQARLNNLPALARATTLNPWEPGYFLTLGQDGIENYFNFATGNPGALPAIQKAVGYLSHEAALDSYNTDAETDYGEALFYEARQEHSTAIYRQALAAFERAKQDDPFNSVAETSIKDTEKTLKG